MNGRSPIESAPWRSPPSSPVRLVQQELYVGPRLLGLGDELVRLPVGADTASRGFDRCEIVVVGLRELRIGFQLTIRTPFAHPDDLLRHAPTVPDDGIDLADLQR